MDNEQFEKKYARLIEEEAAIREFGLKGSVGPVIPENLGEEQEKDSKQGSDNHQDTDLITADDSNPETDSQEDTDRNKVETTTIPKIEDFGFYAEIHSVGDQLKEKLIYLKNGDEASEAESKNFLFRLVSDAGNDRESFGRMLLKALTQLAGSNAAGGYVKATEISHMDIAEMLSAPILIDEAGKLSEADASLLTTALRTSGSDKIVILGDDADGFEAFSEKAPELLQLFSNEIIVPTLTDQELTEYGIRYADSLGYDIDEVGRLALSRFITARQTYYYHVSCEDVKREVDLAIERSENHPVRNLMKKLVIRQNESEKERPKLLERDFKN